MISGLFLAVKLENPEFQDSWSVSQRYWNIDWWQHDLDQIPRPWLPKSCYLPELHPCQIPNIDKCDYVALNKCSLVDLTSSNRCPLIHNLARLLIIINNSNALEEASFTPKLYYLFFLKKLVLCILKKEKLARWEIWNWRIRGWNCHWPKNLRFWSSPPTMFRALRTNL